jgi:cobalt-zinc-cadmium resistance protein CzcA
MRRLSLIVPVALALILVMLYLAFGSVKSALLIILSVPLSLIGGVLGLYITGEYLSVPAALGFVALFGIAVQDSMVLVSCINQLCLAGVPVRKAVVDGAHLRVRPVLMTTVTTMLGLLPLLLSRGVGAEVQRPLAVVVVFGLASSTVLTLLVKPILYEWFEKDEYPYDTGEATHAKD